MKRQKKSACYRVFRGRVTESKGPARCHPFAGDQYGERWKQSFDVADMRNQYIYMQAKPTAHHEYTHWLTGNGVTD
jgi:hypothetical protein